MDVRSGFIDTIGNTPLIKLRRASEETGCTILGKAEFLNPGGSVKDRAALYIIKDAEERGLLRPGGVIVEGTAGNTGIGLALVGNARGYRTVIVMPETQSQEKKDMLRLCGADLRLVPAVPYANPDATTCAIPAGSPRRSRPRSRTARSGPTSSTTSPTGAAITRRPAPRSGSRPTARSTASSARSAPAARCAGVGIALKERNPNVKIYLADPMGSAHLQLVRAPRVQGRRAIRSPRASATTAITKNLEGVAARRAVPDHRRGDAAGAVRPGRARRGWSSAARPAINVVRRDQAGAGAGPGPHDRDDPRRFRHALSVEAVQSGFPARKEPAAAALDEMTVE